MCLGVIDRELEVNLSFEELVLLLHIGMMNAIIVGKLAIIAVSAKTLQLVEIVRNLVTWRKTVLKRATSS